MFVVALCFLGLVIELGPIIILSGFVYCGLDQQIVIELIIWVWSQNRHNTSYLISMHYSIRCGNLEFRMG